MHVNVKLNVNVLNILLQVARDYVKMFEKQSVGIDENVKKQHSRYMSLAVQATVLATTAVISTWFFVFVGQLVYFDIGWFIPLDGMCSI